MMHLPITGAVVRRHRGIKGALQMMLTIAATLAVITGIVHSVLGELLIFRHLRQGTLVPAHSTPMLRARSVRILWATWHLASVFGWAFAGILFGLATSPDTPVSQLVVWAVIGAYTGGSMLVLVGTRGRPRAGSHWGLSRFLLRSR